MRASGRSFHTTACGAKRTLGRDAQKTEEGLREEALAVRASTKFFHVHGEQRI